MLEMLLFYAIPRIDTNVIAHRLLNKFKNIAGVLEADREDILSINGVGENVWLLLKTVGQVHDTLSTNSENAIVLDSPQRIYDFLYARSYKAANEYMDIVFLNCKMEVVSSYRYPCGNGQQFDVLNTLDRFYSGIEKYCLLAHIMPGLPSKPSQEDFQLAHSIISLLAYEGIELAEFLLIGSDGINSIINYRL